MVDDEKCLEQIKTRWRGGIGLPISDARLTPVTV
jgi:hypothetical protein